MLPLSVIMGHFKTLVRDDEATIENIKMIIDEHLEYVIMTREEYNALVKAGLKETMPIGYYQATDAHYCCINARFDVVGITLLM